MLISAAHTTCPHYALLQLNDMSSSEIQDEILGARSDIAECGIPESAIRVRSLLPWTPPLLCLDP